MAITQNTYTGNGSTVLYSFTFPYLETTDIKVSLDGAVTTAYTLANATTVQFNTAPANGAAIRIYRQTDDNALTATFSPGSAIRSQDLNDNFTQNLYVTQESNREASQAVTTANAATTTANTALSNSNTAISTANTASTNASNAVTTANTASSNASAAVATANTASSNATTAVNTANSATATANSATSTANSALSTANAALSTANTASTNATNAVNTANSASSAASSAVSTANTASSNATTAVNTANSATSTANSASSTANTALSTANAAINAVANAVIYTPVADLTALAALSPANGDYFELSNSTGAESSALITGVTAGLVGAAGLTFRLRYDSPPGIFVFLGYFANDSETRYLKLSGGTLTGNLEIGTTGTLTFEGSTADGFETTLAVADPTADRTITLPNQSGNVIVSGNASIVNADVSASAAIDGSKINTNFGSQTISTTGIISAAAGTAAAPSITFTGDVDTGVYSPAANNFGITTAGTERVKFTSGQVIFNDNGDNYDFQIEGDTDQSLFFLDASADAIGIGNSTPSVKLDIAGSDANLLRLSSNNASGVQQTFIYNNSYIGGIGSAKYWDATLSASAVGLASNANLDFLTNQLFRARITTAGNFGINDSAPDARLTVNGIASFGAGAEATPSIAARGDLDTGIWFPALNNIAVSTAGLQRLRINSTGNVGIGTTSPNAPLEVRSDGVGSAQIFRAVRQNGTDAAVFRIDVNADANEIVYRSTGSVDGAHVWAGGTSERARIDTSGRLLVGTSTASGSALLQVAGDAQIQSLNGGPLAGSRNRIINGDMRIDQRNAGAAVTVNSSSATFSVDRWYGQGDTTDGVFTLQRVADGPTGFTNSVRATVTTADSSIGAGQAYRFVQRIEGHNVEGLGLGTSGATAFTISFWVKSSLTGTFGGSLWGASATEWFPFSYTISSANTWEYKTVSVSARTTGSFDNSTGVGLQLQFSLGAGSSRLTTGGSWTTNGSAEFYGVTGQVNPIATLNATWQITGVQLEAGTVATPFERRSYGQELALCQRYYEAGMVISYSLGNNSAATATKIPVGFLVAKREAPSVTYSNVTLSNINNLAVNNVSTNGFSFRMNANNGAISCDATVNASAEL